MAVFDLLIPRIRGELLFPDLYPALNSTNLGVRYFTEIRRRLYEQNPRYSFRPRIILPLEDLPFYQENLAKEGEKTEEVVAEKLFSFFRCDREVIVEVMKVLDLDVGNIRSSNTFLRLHRRYLERALQDLSKEKGDGSYVITVEEIPGLDREEGVDLLVGKIVSKYRSDHGIPQEEPTSSESAEEVPPMDLSSEGLEELQRQVESLEEGAEEPASSEGAEGVPPINLSDSSPGLE